MKILKNCPCCNKGYYETIEQEITFTSNNQIIKAIATRLNDSFYEITKGLYIGNLVHIFDVIN